MEQVKTRAVRRQGLGAHEGTLLEGTLDSVGTTVPALSSVLKYHCPHKDWLVEDEIYDRIIWRET